MSWIWLRRSRRHGLVDCHSPAALARMLSAQSLDCARRYGAGAVYTDYRRMLDEVRPEAVLVVGPPQLHLEAGLEAAARGIHMFVEKPSARIRRQLNCRGKQRLQPCAVGDGHGVADRS